MRGSLVASSTVFTAPVIIASFVLVALFPPILIILIPTYAVIGYLLFRKPKSRPKTLDEWWDDNWRSHL